MSRPNRLFMDTRRSIYWYSKETERFSLVQVIPWVVIGGLFPYVGVKSYIWLDKLPYWDQRIMRKRMEKMAFDFMLKTYSDQEGDLLEEFSNY
mmetsp:Transcript_36198/g.35143  ORF Transcript_36198/g.35143 Transcript_36198/m.35143 type:complete len:93 (-) Transcript_36198:7-285(-)